MESSGSMKVLQEPALLYLVLCHLSQQDLLRMQRICQSWAKIISTDSRLLAIMWLRPDNHVRPVDDATTQINPLLRRTFPTIFQTCGFWDGFTTILDRHSPFMDMWISQTPHLLERLTYPNASWRRMIPCFPPPDQLLVNVSGEEQGKVLRLNFGNQNAQGVRPSHPTWLTFGMLYDIVECAWHQADPWRLHAMRFDFPSTSNPKAYELVPKEAVVSTELRATAGYRAGRVRLHLEPDTRSEVERRKVHDEVIAELLRGHKKTASIRHKIPREIFTDEFHFADALSLDKIEWDEVHAYEMPPRVATPVAQRNPHPTRMKRVEDKITSIIVKGIFYTAAVLWWLVHCGR